jgi:uncharacterized protein YggE
MPLKSVLMNETPLADCIAVTQFVHDIALPNRILMRTLLALAALIAAVPSAATAQVQPRDTTVVVNITRTARAPADRASFYLGVEALAETTPLAIERLELKLKIILDSVKRASPTVQTDVPVVVGVGPGAQSGYPQPTSPAVIARAAVRVTVSKLAELPTLQLAAAAAGAIMTAAPQYESSLVESVWKAKALEAQTSAHEAAVVAADALGYRLGRLLTLNVSGGPQNVFQQQTQLMFDPRNNYSPMYAPEIVVNATVSATYLLMKK